MSQQALGRDDVEKALPLASPELNSEKGAPSIHSSGLVTFGDNGDTSAHQETLERGLSSRQVTMIAIA